MTLTLKPLGWTHIDYHYAVCPITHMEFSIHHEQDKYWGSWRNAMPEGRDTVEEVQAEAEAWRAAHILPLIEQGPITVAEAVPVLQEWARNRRWSVAAERERFGEILNRAMKEDVPEGEKE